VCVAVGLYSSPSKHGNAKVTWENVHRENAHFPCISHIDMYYSAGVMYWGDASYDKIETAYLNGTGRRTLLTETRVHYFGFVLYGGNIYFTDWSSTYASFVSPATKLIGECRRHCSLSCLLSD